MSDGATDPRWPTLLSISAHELRSPISVVAGYIRMLLKERGGPINEQQRRMLEEAEKSCGRLSSLLSELSDLSQLESGTAPFNRHTVNLHAILTDAIAALPALQDRSVTIELAADGASALDGDAVRLKAAFSSILHALRRELVTSTELAIRVHEHADGDRRSLRITIGEPIRIDALVRLEQSGMAIFDEWRGGSGLSLPNARRIIAAHGGSVWSPADDGKSSAIVMLPLSPVR